MLDLDTRLGKSIDSRVVLLLYYLYWYGNGFAINSEVCEFRCVGSLVIPNLAIISAENTHAHLHVVTTV